MYIESSMKGINSDAFPSVGWRKLETLSEVNKESNPNERQTHRSTWKVIIRIVYLFKWSIDEFVNNEFSDEQPGLEVKNIFERQKRQRRR